eukprot:858758_1
MNNLLSYCKYSLREGEDGNITHGGHIRQSQTPARNPDIGDIVKTVQIRFDVDFVQSNEIVCTISHPLGTFCLWMYLPAMPNSSPLKINMHSAYPEWHNDNARILCLTLPIHGRHIWRY